MEEKNVVMPVVALRGLTVLPGMTIHFDVSREKSVRAVEKAMVGDQQVFLTAQKDPDVEQPAADQLYAMGTVVHGQTAGEDAGRHRAGHGGGNLQGESCSAWTRRSPCSWVRSSPPPWRRITWTI